MKTFLVTFTSEPATFDTWFALPEDVRKAREHAGVVALHQWIGRNQASIVEAGSPLGKTTEISRAGTVSEIRNNLIAYTVVQAESKEAVVDLFRDHPHLSHFAGDGIEIMERLPIPQP